MSANDELIRQQAMAAAGGDVHAAKLTQLTYKAIEHAMSVSAIVLCTAQDGEQRKLRKSDARILERAGLSGWEVETLRIVGDETLDVLVRAKAIKGYQGDARERMLPAIRRMSRSLCGW